MNMYLIRPDARYERSFKEGYRELQNESEQFAWVYLGGELNRLFYEQKFDVYVDALLTRETEPLPGKVPDTVYWAILNDEVVGRIALRHELNDHLRQVGGHIGYVVRPSFRRKGIGSAMLKEILKTPLAKAIGKILITCDESNLPSTKIIENAGGNLEDSILIADGLPLKRRYWIEAR
ncbi:MAG: GNAT family N-acetyltransferase [Proteobacteria bacterium]|nr:GNAT family N-acetyltransferase [Pseudomonadota bacterium]